MKIGSQSLLSTEKAQALQKTSNAQELLYHRLANFMGKAIWIGLIFGCHTMALAQQKIKDGSISGNNLPNKDALLELESNNKGLLHARVALRLTTDAFPLTAHVAGMMVYNITTTNDVVPGIYYNDGSKWVFVKSSNAILVEDQWGKTGAPGIPGTVGGPGIGVTIVNNDSGTWVFNPTTNTWTNIRGPQGPQGIQGIQGPQGVQGVAGTNGTDGKSVSSGTGAPTGGNNGDTYINTTTGDIYTNTGGVWNVTGNIRGPQGPQGVQGVAGTNGTNGTDGRTILSGTGVPSAGTGSNGDYYYDPTTNIIYGPKTGGAWPAGVSLVGPQGPQGPQGIQGVAGTNGTNGTDGRTILSGTGVPSAGTGSNGDYYYDPTTNIIYGPKTGGAWPTGVSLVGPQGPQGVQGIQGVAGTNGTNGTDGKSVSSGTGAPTGGNNGDTYINTTTGDIYTNTGGVWNVTGNIRGPQGPQGVQGVAGTNGTDGRTILSGTGVPSAGTGSNGDYYYDPTTNIIYGPKTGGAWPAGVSLAGPQGPQGIQGIQGPQGVQGVAGTNGTDGRTILSGTGVPSAGTGSNGDYYYDPTTNIIYGPKTGGAWPAGVSLVGPQGPAGTTAAVTADNGLTKTADNIQLGGPLVKPTVITTDATNTLTIAGLQTGASTDNLVVIGAGGVLKSINPAALSVTEVDGVIGNEVTDATANGGLARAGAGTTASPYTLGLTPGTVTGNVMTWNGTAWNPAAPLNIYNANGTLTSDRQVNMGGRSLRFFTTDRDIYLDPNGRIGVEAKGTNDADLYLASGTGATYSRLDMQSFPNGQINLTATGLGAEQMLLGTNATTVSAPLIFSTSAGSNASGTEKMRITGTGNVGVNTDIPTEKLDNNGITRLRNLPLNGATNAINTTIDGDESSSQNQTFTATRTVVADANGVLGTVVGLPAAPVNIYTANGTLTSARTLTLGGFPLNFSGTEQTISLNSLGWLQLNGQGTNSSFMRMSTTDGNSNGIKSNFDMQLFPDNIMQLYATDEVSRISFGTHETLNPSPIDFVTSSGANAPGQIRMTVTPTGEVAIGAITAPSFVVGSATIQPKLHVAGDISTTGKIYTTNSVYADYVFEDYFNGFSKIYKDYKFKSLKEVAEFIKAKRHLPGVTPINEIAVGKNGYTIDLTQLSIQQLEKLEELYLHVIEMNDTLSQKDKEIKALQNKTNELEERLKKLEDLIKK